jgi:hypothetical protein
MEVLYPPVLKLVNVMKFVTDKTHSFIQCNLSNFNNMAPNQMYFYDEALLLVMKPKERICCILMSAVFFSNLGYILRSEL